MKISIAPARSPDFSALLALLPTLPVQVPVLIDATPQLSGFCSPEQRVALEASLRAAFGAAIAPAVVTSAVEPELHAVADAVLTLVLPAAAPLPPQLAETLAGWRVQPRALRRLRLPGAEAFELYLDDWARCKSRLPDIQALADRWSVDLTLAPADSKRQRRRLLVFDMDSTLIRCEVIDELARRAGVGEEVAAITERAMRGELDFKGSFRARMARLRGLSAQALDEVAAALPLMPGAEDLLRSLRAQGHYTAILSGGFDYFANQLQRMLGLDAIHANHLHIVSGQLTGEVEGEIIDGERKALLLRQLAAAQGVAMEDTVAVGDGANDLLMLAAAGMGVAYHAKPLVRQQASYAIMHADLSALLAVLGIPLHGPDTRNRAQPVGTGAGRRSRWS